MIVFDDVGKAYRNRRGEIEWIFRNLSMTLPKGRNVGILAPSGSGKTTLIDLAAGNDLPSEGTIIRQSEVSWPYLYRGHMSGKLTGRQNLRFLADIYGRNFREAYEFVLDFAEIGRAIDMPLRKLTNEQRNRLATAILFAMQFEHILVDDAMDTGDLSFRKKCADFITGNKDRITLFIVTENVTLINRYCDIGGVLNRGELTFYHTVQDAVAAYGRLTAAYA